MEKICPICNALQAITARCQRCGGDLVDAGRLEDFRGPYSPYMDVDLLQNFTPDTQCVHLLTCRNCGYDTRAAWELVAM